VFRKRTQVGDDNGKNWPTTEGSKRENLEWGGNIIGRFGNEKQRSKGRENPLLGVLDT